MPYRCSVPITCNLVEVPCPPAYASRSGVLLEGDWLSIDRKVLGGNVFIAAFVLVGTILPFWNVPGVGQLGGSRNVWKAA
ncbi:MAG: hypothetical protein ABSF09_13065 [Candidatus Bathyarchaeia archaeon]